MLLLINLFLLYIFCCCCNVL